MEAPPLKLVVVADKSLEMVDSILADLADGLEVVERAVKTGVPCDHLLTPMLSLACRARAIVIEDREAGAAAWAILENAVNR